MKILYLFLLFVLFSTVLHAQIKSGEVTYNLELGFKPNKESQKNNSSGNSTLKNMINASKKDLAEVKGVLKFNTQESFFSKVVPMQNDSNPSLNVSLSLLGLNGAGYYVSNEENIRLEITEMFDETFLIKDKAFQAEDWSITSETKKIGDFEVYKATTKKVVENSKGKFIHLIIAWFSPEIPFSFGPLGYGGLPGLILELEVQSNFPAIYTIETINFSKKNMEINFPTGKIITPLELDKMAKKGMKNLRN